MKRMKRVAAVMLASAMGLSLTACGGNQAATGTKAEQKTETGKQEGAEKKTETSTEGGKASGEQVEISITHFNIEEQRDGTADYDGFYEMLEQWMAKHPEVKITQSVLETADYETKIQAQAAVNDLPDLFCVKGSWFKNFVESDLVAPLDDMIDSYEKKDAFRSGIFDASTVSGQIYGMPVQFSVTSLVYYNEAMWKEIGYEKFPDNWEDIYTAMEKFKEKGITPFAFGNGPKWPAESCILSALGDRYTGIDWTNSIIANDGSAKFTDPEFVETLEHFQKFAEAGAFNADFNTASTGQAAELYNAGQAAATINGFWNLANILSGAADEVRDNTKIAILPTVEGGKGKANMTSGGCGWYMGMSSKLEGEKKALVEDLLLHLAGYEYSEFITQKYGLVTPCITGDVSMDGFPGATQEYIKLMDTVELTPIYDIMMDPAVIEVMNSGLQELLNGTKDAQTLASEIQAEQDKVAK